MTASKQNESPRAKRVKRTHVDLDRFWDHTRIDPKTGCMVWGGTRSPQGYAWVGGNKLGHRIAWELSRGPIPPGIFVCHHCDNPPCVNPEHLFLGTCADNNRDKIRKGRANMPNGERHWAAKLTWDDVRSIRSAAANGASKRSLAKMFNVNKKTVYQILSGEHWRDDPERAA